MNQEQTIWVDRLRRLRAELGHDQAEMGTLLGVTREWISRLENGKSEFSEFLRLKIMQLEQVSPQGGVNSVHEPVVQEEHHPTKRARDTATIIRQKFDVLMQAAEGRLERLHWIKEQIDQHLKIPHHWIDDEQANPSRLRGMLKEARERAKRDVEQSENPGGSAKNWNRSA